MGHFFQGNTPREVMEPAPLEALLAFLNGVPALEPTDILRLFNVSVVQQKARTLVLDGDQIVFVADTPGEAYGYPFRWWVA